MQSPQQNQIHINDSFQWAVSYTDGSTLEQINNFNEKNAFTDIDRSKLASFSLINKETGALAMSVEFNEDGNKLIWVRRVFVTNGVPICVHILGKKGKFVAAVFQDGGIVIKDKLVKNDPLFDEVDNG